MTHDSRPDNGEIIIYQSDDGKINLDVRLENKTVWLTQDQIAQLFNKGRSTITEHINNIFKENELDKEMVCRKFRHTTPHGAIEGKSQTQEVQLYNLDVIISVGYRVKSKQGTRFRQWATERLAEYIVKGFVLDDERLKNLGGGDYWKELLDRIRDIRSSEKVMYRQVLDLYATSVDYDPRTDTSRLFFKMVQNKLHYAAHGRTAAEVIYDRADSDQPFMGLTSFKGELPSICFFTHEDLVQADFELQLCRLWGRYFSASFRNSRLSWRMRASRVSTEAQSMGRARMLP